jgi:probable HAF family extracellular repeat protein
MFVMPFLCLSLFLCLMLVMAVPSHARQAAGDAVAGAGAAAPVRYRVANLGPGELTELPAINGSGQVAFSLGQGASQLAYMFDGKRVRSLGTLGGPLAYATGINDSSQISGYSLIPGGQYVHAFRWSLDGGMVDLGTLSGGESKGGAINGKGEVVGYSAGSLRPPLAFRWTERGGMEQLGVLSTDSVAEALNDSGLISGFANAADGNSHTFVWTRAGGIRDIGTLGGLVSYPQAVGARGEVAGYGDLSALSNYHAFLWTESGGMRDLGAGPGIESFVLAMSSKAQIAGVINLSSEVQKAMAWSAATGMLDLGTFGGPGARAQNVNNLGQVVGSAMDRQLNHRAFLWSRARGLADLNGRLDNAPAGLVLDDALAISDNGAIVAFSNAGLVLLRPVGQTRLSAPVVGPIDAPALIRTGAAVTMKVAFNDIDSEQWHRASLQWGDATMETALVAESKGAGVAKASHVYAEPGVYTIIARVSDAAGETTTVTRDVVVEAPGQLAAGSGKVNSPLKSYRGAPAHGGPASFRFVVPGQQERGGALRFTASKLAFNSTSMSVASSAPGSGRLTGTGTLNGKQGYRYAADVAPGVAGDAAAQGRFGLRIWHADPAGGADIIDYDNSAPVAGAGGMNRAASADSASTADSAGSAAARGTALLEGAISVTH